MNRRNFLNISVAAGVGGMAFPATATSLSPPGNPDQLPSAAGFQGDQGDKIRPQICLNAYSFNSYLSQGKLGLEEMFRFAAITGFAGIDLTAYYIPEYPQVPNDEILFNIKKMAFRLGLSITGTGVRNDFTLPDSRTMCSRN